MRRTLGRVGIDARLTRQMSVGMQRYVRELARHLPQVAPELEFVVYASGGNFGWNEQVTLPRWIARSRVDLVHFLSQYTPLFVPARSIVTIHDLIHLRFPEQFKAKVGPYYRFVVGRACARAARVITDDERTVEDLQRFLAVDPKKIRVIPLGVDTPIPSPSTPPTLETTLSTGSANAASPYFLYVGNHRRHKNLQTLLDAWSALPERYRVDLCLTGGDDFGGALERASRCGRRARALGELSADDLARSYSGALALVHPSLCEGFGLPLLEAMAAGTPVVVSEEALPGVLEPASLSFPAHDPSALTERLVRILEDQGLRERLVNEGKMLAQALSWDRCARSTADVYREVLA